MAKEGQEPILSVILPCYNEQKNLERGVLDEVAQYLAGQALPWEVLIVNDESTDDSRRLIEDERAQAVIDAAQPIFERLVARLFFALASVVVGVIVIVAEQATKKGGPRGVGLFAFLDVPKPPAPTAGSTSSNDGSNGPTQNAGSSRSWPRAARPSCSRSTCRCSSTCPTRWLRA